MKSCSWHAFSCFFYTLRIVKDLAWYKFFTVYAFIKIDFKANIINIIPPETSKYNDGNFLKKFPNQKPQSDIKNDASPIIVTERTSGVSVKLRVTPDANASILVAIPIDIKHLMPIQQISFSFS